MPESNTPTREEIVDAFMDVLDGVEDHDLSNMTGLPQERCDEIAAIRKSLHGEWIERWMTKDRAAK